MRSIIVVLALLATSGIASAQAPRDVLLNVCNDTGFTIAAASAYRTSPAETRTLRSWFQIEPGACLEGALNNVVGDSLDLHVMSGIWQWPAGLSDATYCLPANATFSLAGTTPCPEALEPRGFRRLEIVASAHRGVGQVNYRIRCIDLDAADANLCVGAPRDAQGLALPVREVEVCNNGVDVGRVAAIGQDAAGVFDAIHWRDIPAGQCAIVYRGFPADGRIWRFHYRSNAPGNHICLTGEDGEVPTEDQLVRSAAACAQHAGDAVPYRELFFGPRTRRNTSYIVE
jgi:uncharacterized membrane protein